MVYAEATFLGAHFAHIVAREERDRLERKRRECQNALRRRNGRR